MSRKDLTQLIRRAQARDADAFDEIIDLFGPRLYGYFCRLCGSRNDAEDLLQELFLRVVRTFDRYVHENQFDAWLFRIATNLVRDRVRRAQRTPPHRSIDVAADETSPAGDRSAAIADEAAVSPPASAQQHEDVDRLQRALAELSDGEREVVMLRHFSQLSFSEIARAMCTPLGTALARGHRGLAKLRALLDTGT